MLLQPREPRGRRSSQHPSGAEARRSWVEVRLRGVAADHLDEEVTALRGQVAELRRILVGLPVADDQLSSQVDALEVTVDTLCRATGKPTT